MVFFVLLLIFSFVHLLLFEEIRLHKDRIVLVRKWMRDRAVELVNARLVTGRRPARKTWFNKDTNKHLAWIHILFLFRGVSYWEDLADPQDARKLNAFLALLSGRQVKEFDQPWTMLRLIKEGSEPRPVNRYALDEALFQDAAPTDFDRVANIGLLIVFLVIMLGNVILLWPFIWSALR
jgi:hypothetical protein